MFVKEYLTRRNWEEETDMHEEPTVNRPVAIISQDACGKVVEIIHDIPGYPKYKVQIYEVEAEVIEDEDDLDIPVEIEEDNIIQYAFPTSETIVFPSE